MVTGKATGKTGVETFQRVGGLWEENDVVEPYGGRRDKMKGLTCRRGNNGMYR